MSTDLFRWIASSEIGASGIEFWNLGFGKNGQASFSQKNVHSCPLVSAGVHSCHIQYRHRTEFAKTHAIIGA